MCSEAEYAESLQTIAEPLQKRRDTVAHLPEEEQPMLGQLMERLKTELERKIQAKEQDVGATMEELLVSATLYQLLRTHRPPLAWSKTQTLQGSSDERPASHFAEIKVVLWVWQCLPPCADATPGHSRTWRCNAPCRLLAARST